MTNNPCPYGGKRWENIPGYINPFYLCGDFGWLCHKCREDRADARYQRSNNSDYSSRELLLSALSSLEELNGEDALTKDIRHHLGLPPMQQVEKPY